MRVCGLNLENLYALLKSSFAQNFLRDAQLQPKLAQKHRISNHATKTNFLRASIFGV
jgi:hypothetical protein